MYFDIYTFLKKINGHIIQLTKLASYYEFSDRKIIGKGTYGEVSIVDKHPLIAVKAFSNPKELIDLKNTLALVYKKNCVWISKQSIFEYIMTYIVSQLYQRNISIAFPEYADIHFISTAPTEGKALLAMPLYIPNMTFQDIFCAEFYNKVKNKVSRFSHETFAEWLGEFESLDMLGKLSFPSSTTSKLTRMWMAYNLEFLFLCIFQAVNAYNKHFSINHNDLKLNNIFLQKISLALFQNKSIMNFDKIYFEIGGKKIYFKTKYLWYIPKIGDWGLSAAFDYNSHIIFHHAKERRDWYDLYFFCNIFIRNDVMFYILTSRILHSLFCKIYDTRAVENIKVPEKMYDFEEHLNNDRFLSENVLNEFVELFHPCRTYNDAGLSELCVGTTGTGTAGTGTSTGGTEPVYEPFVSQRYEMCTRTHLGNHNPAFTQYRKTIFKPLVELWKNSKCIIDRERVDLFFEAMNCIDYYFETFDYSDICDGCVSSRDIPGRCTRGYLNDAYIINSQLIFWKVIGMNYSKHKFEQFELFKNPDILNTYYTRIQKRLGYGFENVPQQDMSFCLRVNSVNFEETVDKIINVSDTSLTYSQILELN